MIVLKDNPNLMFQRQCSLLGGRLKDGEWYFLPMCRDLVEQLRAEWDSRRIPVDLELKENWIERNPAFLGYQIILHNFDELEAAGRRKVETETNPNIAYINIKINTVRFKRRRAIELIAGTNIRLEVPEKILERLEPSESQRWIIKMQAPDAVAQNLAPKLPEIEDILRTLERYGINCDKPMPKPLGKYGFSKKERQMGLRKWIKRVSPERAREFTQTLLGQIQHLEDLKSEKH